MPGPRSGCPRRCRRSPKRMDDARGAMPWQSMLGSMALLGSHDTARWRSMARSDDLALVGLGLLMTMPGSPCFFYGDEVGLTASDNELARGPMPWDAARWDAGWLDTYRRWVRLRGSSPALAHGGFRWVERAPDALAFLRETADERLLVRATRSRNEPLQVPLAAARREHGRSPHRRRNRVGRCGDRHVRRRQPELLDLAPVVTPPRSRSEVDGQGMQRERSAMRRATRAVRSSSSTSGQRLSASVGSAVRS